MVQSKMQWHCVSPWHGMVFTLEQMPLMQLHSGGVRVCRVELDQQTAEVERQRRQLTGAARTQAQLSQLEAELAGREQDLKVGHLLATAT